MQDNYQVSSSGNVIYAAQVSSDLYSSVSQGTNFAFVDATKFAGKADVAATNGKQNRRFLAVEQDFVPSLRIRKRKSPAEIREANRIRQQKFRARRRHISNILKSRNIYEI